MQAPSLQALHLQTLARRCKSMLVWPVKLAARMLLKLSCTQYAKSWHLNAGLPSSTHCHQMIFVLREGDKTSCNMHACSQPIGSATDFAILLKTKGPPHIAAVRHRLSGPYG